MSDPHRPHGLQPTRLLRPWDSPSKSTGVGCHWFQKTVACLQKYDKIFHIGHSIVTLINLALQLLLWLFEDYLKFSMYMIKYAFANKKINFIS